MDDQTLFCGSARACGRGGRTRGPIAPPGRCPVRRGGKHGGALGEALIAPRAAWLPQRSAAKQAEDAARRACGFWLIARCREKDFTLKQLVEELGQVRGLKVDIRSVCGSSSTPKASASKKSVFANEQDRPDVARRREQWRKYRNRIDAKRLVFIDETWTKTNMAKPLRGWGPSRRTGEGARRPSAAGRP